MATITLPNDGQTGWGATLRTAINAINAESTGTRADATSLATSKANVASPTFTGSPSAPTPTTGTNSTRLATTAFVIAQIAASGGSGGTLSWGGITGTLSNQTDLQNALNLKANLASPSFSGTPTAPTATAGTNTTQVATTGFVTAAVAAGGGGVTVSDAGLGAFRGALSRRLLSTPVTIVWRGSSSTAGNAASTPTNRFVNKVTEAIRVTHPLPSGTHPTGLQTLAQAVSTPPSGPGIFGVNAGISGSRSGNQNGATPYVNTTTRNQVAALAPVAVIDMIGANDYAAGISAATYKSNLVAEITALKTAMGSNNYVHVFAHSYPRFDSNALANAVATWADYLAVLRELEVTYSQVVVVNAAPEWAALGVTGAANADPWGYIEADDIHMNDLGHDFMYSIITRKLIGTLPAVATNSGGGGGGGSEPSRTIVTSDTFSGTATTTLSGRSTDAASGGSPIAWASSAFGSWGINSSNQLYRASGATEFVGLNISAADIDMEFTISVLSSHSGTTLNSADVRRVGTATGGDCIRVRMRADGSISLSNIVSGTETELTATSATSTIKVGDRIRIRAMGSAVSVSVNGVVTLTGSTAVTGAGYAGFAKSTTISAVAYDDLAIYSLTAV